MGREIYTTNDQLGGPMIMFPNGVSHQLSVSHLETVSKALTWLAFVSPRKGIRFSLSEITFSDPVDRDIQFIPQKGMTYDPRNLLCGISTDGESDSRNSWISGFFDKDSFVETLGGWAKTVVVGRARLGGIPMGVIITENRTVEGTKPADPADITSQEKMVQQAGGVWFPDSAYKTAQALRDFNREDLPCIIFANWRGFSGGQRDMFDEVLKFGSMIVDALVAYKQPLFVYIPPHAELRGGAWVVVDSTINADVMEFYAAEDARGGVLEATGAASIKFREKDIISTAHRLDGVLISLDEKIKSIHLVSEATRDEELKRLRIQIKEREKMLFNVYQQVAVHFADLHDTPGRMLAKGVIRRQVEWSKSRSFFYWRTCRRLTEFDIAKSIRELEPSTTSNKQANLMLKSWFLSLDVDHSIWESDRDVLKWLQNNQSKLNAYLVSLRDKALSERLRDIFKKAITAASAVSSNEESQVTNISTILRKSIESLCGTDKSKVLEAIRALNES